MLKTLMLILIASPILIWHPLSEGSPVQNLGHGASEWSASSDSGRVFDVTCAQADADNTWIAGSVTEVTEARDQPAWGNGFLVCLGPDGRTLWAKEFGAAEGGESVQLMASSNSKLFFGGFASCNLDQAWLSQAEVDWTKEFYLARLGSQGRLEKVIDLSAQTTSPNVEPYFLGESLVTSSTGEVYLGARIRGKFGAFDATDQEFGQAFLLRFNADLELLQTTALEANSLTCLSFDGERLLGAGTKDGVPGSEMGPSFQRPVLWDLTRPNAAKVLWQGSLQENVRCHQLNSVLLFSSNTLQGALALEVETLRPLPGLPPGVTTLATWPSDSSSVNWAGGFRAQEWLEAPDTVCWKRVEGIWKQAFHEDLKDWQQLKFLLPRKNSLVMIGTAEATLPGEKRWVCRQIPRPATTRKTGEFQL